MRTLITVIGFAVMVLNGFAQSDFYRIGLNAGIDYAYQMNHFSNNEVYRVLNEKQKQRLGVHLKVDFFITKDWGLYLKAHGVSQIESFSETASNTQLQTIYGTDYYISNSEFHRNEGADRPAYSFLSLGGIYQISRTKWRYQFGLGAGVAFLDNPEYTYIMKVKGANQYYKKELQLKTKNGYHFYFEPSVKVSYQLNNRLQLFLTGLYTFVPSQSYTLYNKKTNLYTGDDNVQKASSRSWQQMGQLNIGLNVRLWKIK